MGISSSERVLYARMVIENKVGVIKEEGSDWMITIHKHIMDFLTIYQLKTRKYLILE